MKTEFDNVRIGNVFIHQKVKHLKIDEENSFKLSILELPNDERHTWWSTRQRKEVKVESTLINIIPLLNLLEKITPGEAKKITPKSRKDEVYSFAMNLLCQIIPKDNLIEAKNDYIKNLEQEIKTLNSVKRHLGNKAETLEKNIVALETSISELHNENHSLHRQLDQEKEAVANSGKLFAACAKGLLLGGCFLQVKNKVKKVCERCTDEILANSEEK